MRECVELGRVDRAKTHLIAGREQAGRIAQRIEQHRPRRRNAAADDERLRLQQIGHRSHHRGEAVGHKIKNLTGKFIARRRGGVRANFTVRKVSYGVGVERIFPTHSPRIDKIEVVRHGKVRRKNLYYLRGLTGKAARIKEKRDNVPKA